MNLMKRYAHCQKNNVINLNCPKRAQYESFENSIAYLNPNMIKLGQSWNFWLKYQKCKSYYQMSITKKRNNDHAKYK